MSRLLDGAVGTLLDRATPEPDPILAEMYDYGEKRGFPTIGPEVGRFLAVAARMVDAERIFEFGSGFGYSAAWFSTVLSADAELYLTDFDGDDLDRARNYLDRIGFEGTVNTNSGDALEQFDGVDGSFDVVLIDLDKQQYVEAFDRTRERVRPGGVVIADDMLVGPVEPESVIDALDGEETVDGSSAGIARYIETVRDAPEYETTFLPLGDGIGVSVKKSSAFSR